MSENIISLGADSPKGDIPNTPLMVSLISFVLGSIFAFGAVLFYSGTLCGYWWATYQLGFFLAAWAAFHWGEFAVTAGWNRHRCSVDSFLLNNGSSYHIAHSCALLEYLVSLYFFPTWKSHSYVTLIGIALALAGQALRSTAMIQASSNFSHAVATYKLETHQLVTHGVYAWCRHPSYAGFFYWGLGTQLALQNPISFLVYAIVLWNFFSKRIQGEEHALVRFFGDDYIQYRKRVGTKIPYI
ncbi:hypothetical protein BOTBODRAFT_61814 [Botryobasidium botryosum FD-172 SS1]|uniref:Protein-S-isoprenylcysteine O-methyltransferase n=1 Tax=Botryobasidium botryosum (strain FD-172 SS1) TaxID=930990 RepID=A0A067N189_BOTB1|nr:hypothetical protein BOTBODRAFT_61814 [Botryobasidium botryosum FD-172 SS1]